jgi:hypothetical protein
MLVIINTSQLLGWQAHESRHIHEEFPRFWGLVGVQAPSKQIGEWFQHDNPGSDNGETDIEKIASEQTTHLVQSPQEEIDALHTPKNR